MEPIINKQTRFELLSKLYKSKKFYNKFWVIGCGAVGTALIFLLLKIFIINPKNIIIIDRENIQPKINKYLNPQIKFIKSEITENNYQNILSDIKNHDILINCAYDISTLSLFKLCQEKNSCYIDSSIEEWSYKSETDPIKYSLFYKHSELDNFNNQIQEKKTNFIVSMGCNPGNISIWTKFGLELLNKKYNYKFDSFAELSHKLGIQVIHISEKDTQKTRIPKRENEYANTWASTMEPMYEEGLGPVEISLGTHEKNLEYDTISYINNIMILKRRGMATFGVSYTPISKNYIGMLIRHDENFTIGRELSLYINNKLVYKPSVYYIYHPCDSTMASFYEIRELNLNYQKTCRLLTGDIVSGTDELGLTYFLSTNQKYWIGSLLDIHESREIFENKFDDIINATILQVVAGYLGGIIYLTELIEQNKYYGLLCPDDLPYKKILKYTLPFLGDFIMMEISDWKFPEYNKNFNNNNTNKKISGFNQFSDFLVDF